MIPEDESSSAFNQEEQRVVLEPERGEYRLNETEKALTSLSANSSSKKSASRRLRSRRRRCHSERDVQRRLNGCKLLVNSGRHNEEGQSASASASPDNRTNTAAYVS